MSSSFSTCQQTFVATDSTSGEPWQVPTFFGRDLAPQAYKRPTSCPLYAAISAESELTIGTAMSTRNPEGGVEATLGPGLQGSTPFDFNHPQIAQRSDTRLSQLFTRDNGNYPFQYSDNNSTYFTTA